MSRAAGRIEARCPGATRDARAGDRRRDDRRDPNLDRTAQYPSPRAPTAPARACARGKIVANLSTAALYEAAVRDGEGLIAADGPLVVAHRHAHRPLAEGQVHRPRAVERGEGLVGRRQPPDQRGALRPAPRAAHGLPRGSAPVQPGHVHRRASRPIAARSASTPRPPGRASSPATSSAGRPPRSWRASRPNFTIIDVPSFQADPATEGTRTGDGDPRPPPADGDHHRRHDVRRRDQEVGVHGHELPAARRGRPADALVGQRRRGRRLGRLLRPVGHGQDDALRGPAAEPHRRRRARLGQRRRLQLRGRLLRQDDPPLADVRAGHLRDDAAVRDDPRERRHRPGDARARPRLGAVHREHPRRLPAALHRQRRSDRASPARRATSSS